MSSTQNNKVFNIEIDNVIAEDFEEFLDYYNIKYECGFIDCNATQYKILVNE